MHLINPNSDNLSRGASRGKESASLFLSHRANRASRDVSRQTFKKSMHLINPNSDNLSRGASRGKESASLFYRTEPTGLAEGAFLVGTEGQTGITLLRGAKKILLFLLQEE